MAAITRRQRQHCKPNHGCSTVDVECVHVFHPELLRTQQAVAGPHLVAELAVKLVPVVPAN